MKNILALISIVLTLGTAKAQSYSMNIFTDTSYVEDYSICQSDIENVAFVQWGCPFIYDCFFITLEQIPGIPAIAIPLASIDSITYTLDCSSGGCAGGISSISDIDGNEYPVIQIGNQCWTAENLRTTRWANGSVIPNVMDNTAWANLTTPAWCNYQNNPSFDATYGKLYNWYTVAAANMCPTGWHVPTDAEWDTLASFLGGTEVAGGKLKSTGTQYWLSPNTDATNESGFSGLPGGYRGVLGFDMLSYLGYNWSASEFDTTNAWHHSLSFNNGNIVGDYLGGKTRGFSVRCIRD